MTRLSAMGLIVLLFATGCARTDLTSFKDPTLASGKKYASVMVFGHRMGLKDRQIAEKTLVEEFKKRGKRAIRSIDILPPTGTYSANEKAAKIRATGVETVLFITLTGRSVGSTYIPRTYYPGTSTSYVNIIGNTATVQTYRTPGFSTGGYAVKKPRAKYHVALFDVRTGKRIWIAEGNSRGNSFATYQDLTASASREAVNKLVADGLF